MSNTRRSPGVDPNDPSGWNGDSWVVRWAQGRTPNSPSNPCDRGMVYAAALYWSVMTMTSDTRACFGGWGRVFWMLFWSGERCRVVGYGDILPYTLAEYLICTTCMLISSIVWAYIIGAACAVMSKMDPELSEFERRIDDFNSMAQDQETRTHGTRRLPDLPQHIRWRGREYIREQRFHTHYMRNIDAWEGLGADLRGTVARQVASHYINHIWFFKGTNVQFREDCAKHFAPNFFERREVIELRAQLCVVERGAVGRLGRILEESDIITESTSQKYFADFHALLTKPSCREVAVQGPRRDNKAEAIKECQTAPVRVLALAGLTQIMAEDCEILRKTFENEGELGVKRIAESLRTKASDAPVSTPEALESIYNAMRPVAAPERLIPPGEGWVRFNDTKHEEVVDVCSLVLKYKSDVPGRGIVPLPMTADEYKGLTWPILAKWLGLGESGQSQQAQ
eukprot:g6504.t1